MMYITQTSRNVPPSERFLHNHLPNFLMKSIILTCSGLFLAFAIASCGGSEPKNSKTET
ncbi:MAG: hypothetical protein RI894_2372, partial [Bacteroidota bacterium]